MPTLSAVSGASVAAPTAAIVVTLPGGTGTGKLIAWCFANNTGSTWTTSGAWTLRLAASGYAVFEHPGTGTEGATATFTRATDTTGSASALVVRLADAGTVADTKGVVGGGATLVLPTATSTTAGSMLLQLVARAGGGVTASWTPPGTATERFDQSLATATVSVAGGDETVGVGATGTRTWTQTSAGSTRGVAMVINPPATGSDVGTRAVRTLLGEGYSSAAPTEKQFVTGIVRGWKGGLPPLIYCHGSGDTAENVSTNVGQFYLLRALSERYLVVAADLGLQDTWGNDNHLAKIEDAVDYAASLGATGPVSFVSISMGNLGAMRYARLNPANTRAVAAVIPAISLAELMTIGIVAAQVNAAYGGSYVDATLGPTHSPAHYAASISDDVPVSLFTASNDPIVFPASASQFVVDRPTTERVNLGALGHSEAAISAAIDPVMDFLLST